jgi:hypothetical protein
MSPHAHSAQPLPLRFYLVTWLTALAFALLGVWLFSNPGASGWGFPLLQLLADAGVGALPSPSPDLFIRMVNVAVATLVVAIAFVRHLTRRPRETYTHAELAVAGALTGVAAVILTMVLEYPWRTEEWGVVPGPVAFVVGWLLFPVYGLIAVGPVLLPIAVLGGAASGVLLGRMILRRLSSGTAS